MPEGSLIHCDAGRTAAAGACAKGPAPSAVTRLALRHVAGAGRNLSNSLGSFAIILSDGIQ